MDIERDRPELVARMRQAGLTQQQIADTARSIWTTVRCDLNMQMGNQEPVVIVNQRGEYSPPPIRSIHALAEASSGPENESRHRD